MKKYGIKLRVDTFGNLIMKRVLVSITSVILFIVCFFLATHHPGRAIQLSKYLYLGLLGLTIYKLTLHAKEN
ncbi:hypothetical protein IPM62_04440 [Candidatus Woesebacteria bacterium]|nr:MAG: hypothetical protein IPM62_04440 [Candidatus Woesebacteria bacterium]